MNKKTLATLRKFTIRGNVEILGMAAKSRTTWHATDLGCRVAIPADDNLPDGVYSLNDLAWHVKTGEPVNPAKPIDEWPEESYLPSPGDSDWVAVPGAFSEILGKIRKFAWIDETRYILNGVYFDRTSMVATDGRVLCRYAADYLPESTGNLPVATCRKVDKLPINAIAIGYSDKKPLIAMRTADGTVVVSKGVDGMYPKYQSVIPEKTAEWCHEITLPDLSFFKMAMKDGRPVDNRGSGNPAVSWLSADSCHEEMGSFKGKVVAVAANNGDRRIVGESGGIPCDITLSMTNITLAAQFTPKMMVRDGTSPAFYKDDRLTIVVMPLRMD